MDFKEKVMNRRNFIKATAAGVVGLFLVRKTKAGAIDVPPLPTLEFLQEHNPDVVTFYAEYSTRGTWSGLAFRSTYSKFGDPYIADYRVLLFYEDGRWFAVDKQYRDDTSKLHYYNKISWPTWLRKF